MPSRPNAGGRAAGVFTAQVGQEIRAMGRIGHQHFHPATCGDEAEQDINVVRPHPRVIDLDQWRLNALCRQEALDRIGNRLADNSASQPAPDAGQGHVDALAGQFRLQGFRLQCSLASFNRLLHMLFGAVDILAC